MLFASIEGVGPALAEVLQKAGFTTVEQLASATTEHLSAVQGIGDKTAEKIIDGAKKFVADKLAKEAAQAAEQENADDQNK